MEDMNLQKVINNIEDDLKHTNFNMKKNYELVCRYSDLKCKYIKVSFPFCICREQKGKCDSQVVIDIKDIHQGDNSNQ
jgi:hypothetical protein